MIARNALLGMLALGLAGAARADDFDRLEGRTLASVPGAEGVTAHQALRNAEISALPRVLQGMRAPVVVVRTGDGNLARVAITPALRKPATAGAELVPVLMLERYVTDEAGPKDTRLAWGRDILLFDGFLYDFDTGQVVPEGQGGDVRFRAADGGRLEATDGAKLYTMTRSPLDEKAAPGKPSPGRAIVPGDFAGRYRLIGDGQWSGTLDLEAGAAGAVRGRFLSEQTGQSYPVAGQVQVDRPNHLSFSIEFPLSRQEYDARLWTGGKNVLTGTVSLADGSFGFIALREGASLEPAR